MLSAIGARLRDPRILAASLTIGAGWGGRVVTALAQFASIRLLTAMLGVDGYGAYAAVVSLLAWFALADLGFGATLQNHISSQRVGGGSATEALWTVTYLLGLTSIALFVVVALVSPWMADALLGATRSVTHDDAILGFLAFGLVATGTGAASLALKIQFAEHRGYVAHVVTAASALAGLVGLGLLSAINIEHKFAWSLLLYYLPGLLFPAALLIHRYLGDRSAGLHPSFVLNRPLLATLWREARMFLLFNTLSALVLNVDFLILSQTVDARSIASYSVFTRVFALVFFVFNSVLQASWPLSAEAILRGETHRLRHIVLNCVGFGATVVIVASALFYAFAGPIGRLLAPHDTLLLPVGLIPLFAALWIIRVWTDTFAMLLMSGGKAGFLCVIVPVQAAINLPLGYWGAKHYGLTGLLVGMIASFVLTVVWALPVYIRRQIGLSRMGAPIGR